MKVLRKGRQQDGGAQEYTCGNGNSGCGSLLLVGEGDLYCTSPHHDGSYRAKFCCSECRTETDVDVPSHIGIKVRNREMKKPTATPSPFRHHM